MLTPGLDLTTQEGHPALCFSYEGRDTLFTQLMLPLVDCVEITPDALAHEVNGNAAIPEAAIQEIVEVGAVRPLLIHGVGLSIGSHEGFSERYLALVDSILANVPAYWHSEHLGYTTVDGEHLGTMLALPRTGEVLEMVCTRVNQLLKRYPIPFLVENIVHLLPDVAGDYSDAEFLNELCSRTGCYLLLDVYNLECDAHNHGFDIERFLSDLDLQRVKELHLANGVEHMGMLLDVHSRALRPSTISLARQIIEDAQGAIQVVTYEVLPEAVPILGHAVIQSELERLRAELC